MEISLIIFIVVFIILIFVIFKLIKKIIFAFLTVFILFFVVYFGAVALVYADVNNMVSGGNYSLSILYGEEDKYDLGLKMLYEGQNISSDEFASISEDTLKELKIKDLEKDDKEFVILVSNDFYEGVLENIEYDFSIGEYELFLEKEDVLELVNKDSTVLDLSSRLGADNEEFTDVLDKKLKKNGIEVNEYVFIISLEQAFKDEKNAIKFIDAFKDEEINIYPDRLTFKMLKWLPDSNLKGLFDNDEEIAEE